MTTVKAIETRYAGCRFRSRLEARWAVFFDHLAIQWEYEPEGYELPSGGRYLPDFKLPEFKRWIEVKGPKPREDEITRCFEFGEAQWLLGWKFTILPGDVPRAPLFDPELGPMGLSTVAYSRLTRETIASAQKAASREYLGYSEVGCEDGDGTFIEAYWMPGGYETCLENNGLVNALNAARSARFEHGESG